MRVSGTLLAPALLVLIILLISAGRTDAAEPPAPLIVDADEVVYDEATQTVVATGSVRLSYRGFRLSADHVTVDLRTEQLAARGHVILVDAQGRELRGEVLTYDVRTEQAEMLKTETVLERVHIRSERIETKGTHVIAHEATFTTCDPDRPAYRVTASRIEVFPGERIVATHASLWLGRYRLFTLPVLVFSLKPGEGVRNIPRFGYNGPDGLWADYTYQYLPGPLRGALYGKYGTRSGFIVNNTLTYGLPAYAFTLVAGRAQNADLKIFDLAEFSFSTTPHALGGLPLLVDLGAAIGWFRETAPDLSTSRWLYRVGISTTPIPLGPRTQWKTSSSWQDAAYGQGSRQSVLSVNSAVTHQIDASSSLTLAYRLLNVDGATPFVFDRISTESRVHDLSLQYALSRERAPGTTTTFNAGTTYYFREIPVLRGGTAVTFLPGPSVSVNLGYGERVPDRHHWNLSAEYNLTVKAFRLWTNSGLALGRGTYITIVAIYNTAINTFEDVDYILTSRFCDCIDLSLRYRQVRQEIWVEVGLAAFPDPRLQGR